MPWDEALLESQVKDIDRVTDSDERCLSYTEALHEALELALEADENTFVLGQGVNDPPVGMFGVTTDLYKKFGEHRVFDTPLSEEGLTGLCTGAAMNGLRPIYLHNRPDFLLLTFNQLVNHASKIHYMDKGHTKAPMVVWSAIGRGWGSGAQHSQAIQGLLLSVPGLKIIMPSTPYDAKGLMLSAIVDNNPVLIFEHRWLMKQQGSVPEGIYKIPIGKGVYRQQGEDLTIVGSSHAIVLAETALKNLSEEGVTADLIDLRTIKPLDENIIIESVKKTGRLLVVDTGWAMGGVCAEIGCLVAEKAFEYLKSPINRVGLPDSPTPAGFTLEQYYYPTSEKIADAIKLTISK